MLKRDGELASRDEWAMERKTETLVKCCILLGFLFVLQIHHEEVQKYISESSLDMLFKIVMYVFTLYYRPVQLYDWIYEQLKYAKKPSSMSMSRPRQYVVNFLRYAFGDIEDDDVDIEDDDAKLKDD